MIDIHWFALVGIGTGFRIDRKWTENFAKRVAAAEASIAVEPIKERVDG